MCRYEQIQVDLRHQTQCLDDQKQDEEVLINKKNGKRHQEKEMSRTLAVVA